MIPRIGLSYIEGEADGRPYAAALAAAGAAPVVLAEGDDCPASIAPDEAARRYGPDHPGVGRLRELDGLLLIGGPDVDPSFYGEELNGSDWLQLSRDYLELAQIRLAHERGLPVLGICRGIQVLNVALGGSLVQHLPSASLHAVQRAGQPSKAHRIKLSGTSRLGGLLLDRPEGERILAVNSRHHQGTTPDRLAPGTIATAYSLAGDQGLAVVEALETAGTRDGGEFVVGVQWHPERLSDEIPRASDQPVGFRDLSLRLFRGFVAAARER